MLVFHQTGRWRQGQVRLTWTAPARRLIPEVEAIIDRTWETVLARPGVRLFDGPMCRLESWSASADELHLVLSETSYKPFVGTNLYNPELLDRFGREVMANPVGVSPALLTRDGFLLMGRRNASVAYYPNRIHPFAGALEPRDRSDVFDAVRRELHEELRLNPSDVAEIVCTGVVEDVALRHPELVFAVRSTRTRSEIESQVDADEHHATWGIEARPEVVEESLKRESALTPIACAAMLLWGRIEFGDDWFNRASIGFIKTR